MNGIKSGMPRVLVLASVLSQPMGGVRRHNAELLPRAAELLRQGGGSLSVLEGRGGIPFPLPDTIQRITRSIPTAPPPLRAMAETLALRGLPDFDLVHSGHLPLPLGVRGPLSVTRHDLRDLVPSGRWKRSGRPFARFILQRSLSRAASVLVPSQTIRTQAIARLGIDPARIHVVPNGCDHLPVELRCTEPGAPLLAVGHIEPRKNLKLLVEALALDTSLPDLTIVGADRRGHGAELRALASARGQTDRVRFLGAVEDGVLARLYAQAACVVLPSHYEGFGIAVLEAMRAGTPLTIAGGGAMAEVAGPEVPAFHGDDPADCAEKIRSALATPSDVLVARGRLACEQTWDKAAERLIEAWCAAVP